MTPIILMSNDNRDNGALASLDLSNNDIFYEVKDEGPAPALAEALKKCTSLHTLSISSNWMKAIHAKILAPAIQDMGALAKMTIGESKTPATLELGMTEGNFSGAGLGPGGAIILASWIEHK